MNMQDNLIHWEKLISPNFTQAELWEVSSQPTAFKFCSKSCLPNFQIAGDVLEEMSRRKKDCVLPCFKLRPGILRVEEVRYNFSNSSDYSVYLQNSCVTQAKLEKTSEYATDNALLQSGCEKYPEVLDFVMSVGSFQSDELLNLSWYWVYPKINLTFTPLPAFKIISNPLSKELFYNSKESFRTGLVSMDNKSRLVMMLGSDPMAQQYPCVGIWISGLSPKKRVSRSALWAACARYILSENLRKLVNTNSSFIAVVFDDNLNFYEVGIENKLSWCSKEIEKTVELPVNSLHLSPQISRRKTQEPLGTARFGDSQLSQLRDSSLECSVSDIFSNSQSEISSFTPFSPQAEEVLTSQSKEIKQLKAQLANLEAYIKSLPLMIVKPSDKATTGTNTSIDKDCPVSPDSDSTRCFSDQFSSPEECSIRSRLWESPEACIPKIEYNSIDNTFEDF